MKAPIFYPVWMLVILCMPLHAFAQLPTPVQVSPANGATGLPTTVTISWQAVAGADQYKVAVGTDIYASGTIVWDTTYAGTSYTINNLAPKTYYWRIKAKKLSPYQASTWSGVWKFTVGNGGGSGGGGGGGSTSLNAPSLLFPSNNAAMQVPGVNLSWGAVTGATYYKVKVATDQQMSNVVFCDTSVTAASRLAKNLGFATTYFWTVQAANASTQSPVSTVRTFTTLPDNPNAVTSHPRLLFTQADLPRLRSWATNSNPVYVALTNALNTAIYTYNNTFFPGGQPNPNWPDNGGTTWSGYVTESYAEFFAFWSLIDPNPANRPVHAQRARNLLMYVIDQAMLGPSAGVPFRDPAFMTYDRSRVYGEACPLTVDWIYDAKDANNNDILTAADKARIRTVFMRWCNDQLSAYNHPTPIGLSNDKAIQLTNRWILNNYYSGHARNLTLMSLCIDPANDVPLDTTIHYSALGNSLRSYIFNATGAWLFQQYAQYEKPDIVAADYGIPMAGLGMGSGGLSVEGSLYGESIGWVAQELLALKKAGWADTAIIGKQAKLLTSSYWTRLMDGLLHTITPSAKVFSQMSYLGPVYQAANYGDLLRTWIIPELLDVTAPIGLIDMLFNNNQSRLDKSRWFSRNAIQGGNGLLAQRISNIWPNSYATHGIYYFMLLDPNGSNPPDPRPSVATTFWDPAFKRLLARTDWTANATWFDWQCHWTTINHQSGDGNQFELFRKGEWLVKERSGYTNDGVGYTSQFHNTLGIQNDVPANMQWFEGPTSQRGGQWTNGLCSGDPSVVTSIGNSFVYATGDATNLYNRTNSATDILYAVRSIVWLKPDHVVVYDRAKSKTANRFKRFFLQLTAAPNVTGRNATVNTPGGQKLFISNLLPAASVLTPAPAEALNALAELEPTTHELKIEDPANPTDVRFLNILQGADGNGAKDTATLVQSTAGTAFEGTVVKNMAVMFPNVWGAPFTSTTYTVPATVASQIVTGMTPNAGYDVSFTSNGSNVDVTITPGSQLTADAGGVLLIGPISVTRGSLAPEPGQALALSAAPNPFGDATTLRFALPEASTVTLKVYDFTGKVVTALASNEWRQAGQHEAVFRAGNLPNGLYRCELTAGTQRTWTSLLLSR